MNLQYRKITQETINELLRAHERKIEKKQSAAGIVHQIFNGYDLQDRDFSRRNLTDACFSDIKVNNHTSFYGANLTSAKFYYSDLRDADFRAANLTHCRFEDCIISGESFKGVQCGGTDFINTDTRDLCISDISPAPISDAAMIAKLSFRKYNEGIIGYVREDRLPTTSRVTEGTVLNSPFSRNPLDTTNSQGIEVHADENFGTDENIWKVLIRWPWLAGVIPSRSKSIFVDGYPDTKILRCERCEVLSKVIK